MPPAAKRFKTLSVEDEEGAERLRRLSAEEDDEDFVYVQRTKYNYGTDGPMVKEVPYVRGQIHGLFTWRWSSGDFVETPYVRGVIHGVERERRGHSTIETPWVCGMKHGLQRVTWRSGAVTETPFVHGEIHGVLREVGEKEPLTELTYVHGFIYGMHRKTWKNGEVVEADLHQHWHYVARARWRWLMKRKRWWWLSEERANVAACVDNWLLKNGLASWIDAKAARRGAWQTLT